MRKNTALFVLGAFFSSFILLGCLFSNLWFFHTYRTWYSWYTSTFYHSMFAGVSHILNGGVELWNRFSQQNDAYYAIIFNHYSFLNIITTVVFVLLSGFISTPGEVLFHIHFFIFYCLMLLIRTIGTYLLLRKFSSNKVVIFVSILCLNTFLTSYMNPGFCDDPEFSFFPLLLYFILCFFEDFRLRHFLLAMLVMVLCSTNSLLFTFGYFYQAVHFIILYCVILFMIQRGWRKFRGRPTLPGVELKVNIVLALSCFFIILPYIWWVYVMVHDFALTGSGIQGTQGRLGGFFDIQKSFYTQGRSFANPLEFIGSSMDYRPFILWGSWPFTGGSVLFLSLAGTVLSKDKRKFLFITAILILLLLNTCCYWNNFYYLYWLFRYAWHNSSNFWMGRIPFDQWSLGLWVLISNITHVLNIITNPFSCLVRAFQFSGFLIGMLLVPLVAMGIESCFHWYSHRQEAIHYQRRWGLLAFGVLVLLWDLMGGTQMLPVFDTGNGDKLYGVAGQNLGAYIFSLAGTFIVFMLAAEFFPIRARWFGGLILLFAFAADFAGLKTGLIDSRENNTISPIHLQSSGYTRQAFVPDYQNPRVLPFNEYVNTDKNILPIIGGVDTSLMFGDFWKFVTTGQFFRKKDLKLPRHISFKDLDTDIEVQQYLTRNPRAVFWADYAFDSKALSLSEILHLNLESRVVVVDEEKYNKPFIKEFERVYLPLREKQPRLYSAYLDVRKARVLQAASGWEYIFDLPKDFPFYLSTNIFSRDYDSWRLVVNSRLLSPMQGKLTAPYTYDVQNIQEKKAVVLLPLRLEDGSKVQLQVKLPDNFINIWKNTSDDLGFTYEAPRAGWLVFNYPYDKKWELTIDNQNVPLSKVNRYFIGAPILEGKHQILLRYWPHTWLRFWIFISMVLSVICFVWLMFYCLKQEPL